jgi:TIR domain
MNKEAPFWDARKLKPIGIGIAALLAISLSYVGVKALTKPSAKPPTIVVQPSPVPTPPTRPSPAGKWWVCPYCGSVQWLSSDSNRYNWPTCQNCGHVADFSIGSSSGGSTPSVSVSPTVAASPSSAETSPSSSATASATNALEAVDAALKKLDLGNIAFKVPERLPVQQHATVILLLSPTQNAAQLTATLRQETAAGEKVESDERIQISGLMEAKLSGPAFDIRAITPEEPQMVSRTEPTEWKWDVTPKQAGQQSLHLTINAIVKFDGANHPRTIRSFDRTIQVEVPAGFSLASGVAGKKRIVIGLIALIIVATGFLSWRLNRRSRSKPALTTPPTVADGQDLFVSYSRRDQKQVLALTKQLEERGFRVWIDQHRLDGATLWPKEVTEALLRARVFVLVVSKASVVSTNVIRELSLASEESKTILPLQLEAVEIPSSIRYQLAGIQYLVLNPRNPQENVDQIIHTLSKLGVTPGPGKTTRRKVPRPLVRDL